MTIEFDTPSINLPCPVCGQMISGTIRQLTQDPTLTCPACASKVNIDSAPYQQTDKSIQNRVAEALKNLGKPR
ncbi:hypothetical protein ACVCH0_20735 [Burkholderia glumae]|uniref:hypothetical protein n=1 Tax=Burkholderia glumae TaxID=337 RepID=UPI0012F8E1EC|nr:hypothetical protein [Burkholderia glumae]